MSAETRDEMDPLTRAVSDTLDEYLARHHGILTSHTNPEDFLTWLRENGHEVRPSVTDNARAEAWDEGWFARAQYDHTPDVDEPVAENPYRAAGRAETTTAPAGDAARVIANYLAAYTLPANYSRPISGETHRAVAEHVAPLIARELDRHRLLATARTRPTETTTEWGVRYRGGNVIPRDTEQAARNYHDVGNGYATPVRREITPWTEVGR